VCAARALIVFACFASKCAYMCLCCSVLRCVAVCCSVFLLILLVSVYICACEGVVPCCVCSVGEFRKYGSGSGSGSGCGIEVYMKSAQCECFVGVCVYACQCAVLDESVCGWMSVVVSRA